MCNLYLFALILGCKNKLSLHEICMWFVVIDELLELNKNLLYDILTNLYEIFSISQQQDNYYL